jgi:hypothetical protein
MDKLPSYNGFSVVVINNSGIILKKDVLSLDELMEIARSARVEAIAIDNIYELGSEGDIKRLSTLLQNVDLVQVTGSPSEGFRTLSAVGKGLGFSSGEKLNPSRSAEICARAALEGVGSRVKLYEPETRVSISRRRRFGTGGMSEGRYRRSIQGSVLNLTNSIETSLKSRGIDFDLNLRKGSHGVEGSTFFIYAPRNRLIGLVRPLRTSSIDVRVTPVYTKALEYESMGGGAEAKPKRHLIVGVDPGMVTGLAAIDMNGRVLGLTSGRGITRGEMTRWVRELGKATAIASDVSPPPALVVKLASSHGAILYVPEVSLKTSDKKALVEHASNEQGIMAEDTHQRAALAAALKAFASYRNKLEQAGSHVRKEGKPADLDKVKSNVLRGMSISDAIESSRLPVFEESHPAKRRMGSEREQIRVLESKCQELREERDSLEGKIGELQTKLDDLENDLRLTKLEVRPRLSKEGKIYELERRIASLLGDNAALRGRSEFLQSEILRIKGRLEGVASGKVIVLSRHRSLARVTAGTEERSASPLLVVESLGQLDEASLKRLKECKVRAVIMTAPGSEDKEFLWEIGIPVISLSRLDSETVGGVEVIEASLLKTELERGKREMDESALVRDKKFRQIFYEYKKERTKPD